ncbi:MAG: TIR domain-containing protein [Bacteroidia bacterium]
MKIFISHSTEDKYCMEALQTVINKTNVFTPVVIVRQEDVMKDFVEKVSFGINSSYYLIPILTENSWPNQWVNQEIGYAIGRGINVVPIVEKSLIGKLNKGFIHNYRDLPFSFNKTEANEKLFRKKYREACEKLIENLLIKHKYSEDNINQISQFFTGKWKSDFDPSIKIKGNEYYVNEKLEFYIDHFNYDANNGKVSFRKLRARNINEVFKVELSTRVKQMLYNGFESASTDGGQTYDNKYNISFRSENYKPQVRYNF